MSFDPFNFASGGLVGGLFGTDPELDAQDQYKKYYQQAIDRQNPFYKAGTDAIPQYQDWLSGQKNPSQFINNLMNGYKESSWAHNLQLQSQRAGTNAASASGITGSTPFAQQLQQNSANISSGDIENWLQNVLGINTQYGNGLNNEVGWGQHSADVMSGLYKDWGDEMGASKYHQGAQRNQDIGNLFSFSNRLGVGPPAYMQH